MEWCGDSENCFKSKWFYVSIFISRADEALHTSSASFLRKAFLKLNCYLFGKTDPHHSFPYKYLQKCVTNFLSRHAVHFLMHLVLSSHWVHLLFWSSVPSLVCCLMCAPVVSLPFNYLVYFYLPLLLWRLVDCFKHYWAMFLSSVFCV